MNHNSLPDFLLKQFAVFLYDPTKDGFERWSYICDTKTEDPVRTGKAFFETHLNYPSTSYKEIPVTVKINGQKFARQIAFFNGYGKEIVLAERMD